MSTPKNNVTTTFLALLESRDLCVDLTDEEMTEILDVYLKDATYLRFKNCTKDLSDHEDYDFYTETSTATGLTDEFTISQYPTSPHADAITYVCKVNDTSVGYTFDANTLTFTLSSTPSADDSVEVGYEFYGQFNETLTQEEILILAWGMIVSWRQKVLNNHRNMKNRISPKDYTAFSPANLLKALTVLSKEAERQIRDLRVSYSFDSTFEGFTPI